MPLGELTVVDISTLAAAPQIAAFFGDFGARVIKVEHPRGDPLRKLVDKRGAALQWKIVNRNKQCVTLDIGNPAGRALLERLLERADLLVCNLNATRLQRWQLEPNELKQRHSRLVVVNLTTFGTTGPWADRGGSGTLAEAMAGLASLSGNAADPPQLSPVGLGDYLGVLQGIIAALFGLYRREVGKNGSAFDVAMYEPILGLLSQRLAATQRDGIEPARLGNRFPTMAPRNTYRTSDGEWVALTAGTDELVRRMFALFGRPELAADARFRDNTARLQHVDELDAIIAVWIGAHSRDEVVEAFARAGVSLAAVDGLKRVLTNPQINARQNLVQVQDDEVGPLTIAAPTPIAADGSAAIQQLGRGRGADNALVYRDWLGLSADELAQLRAAGIV